MIGYINNNLYVSDMNSIQEFIGNMFKYRYDKRKIYYVTDAELFLPEGNLAEILDYYKLEIRTIKPDIDIMRMSETDKMVVIFGDEEKGYKFIKKHFNSIAKKLDIDKDIHDGFIDKFGLEKYRSVTTYDVDVTDAKHIPFEMLLYYYKAYLTNYGKCVNGKVKELLLDKLLSMQPKVYKQQVETALFTLRQQKKYLMSIDADIERVFNKIYSNIDGVQNGDFESVYTVVNNAEHKINAIADARLRASLLNVLTDLRHIKDLYEDVYLGEIDIDSLSYILDDCSSYFENRGDRINCYFGVDYV